MLNLLGGNIRGRLDLTREGLYTLSDGTREILGELDATPGLLTVDIDTGLVESVRKTLPVLGNRRQF